MCAKKLSKFRLFPLLLAALACSSTSQLTFAADSSDDKANDLAAVELLSADELRELVGPIALYPDDLLAVVLPASTHPLQVVAAARYREAAADNSSLTPEDNWDESVVALLNYPEALALLNNDLEWTGALGQAVLEQQADVLAAVKSFRDEAYAAGNLKSDQHQVVEVDSDDAVTIKPTDPKVVYVPYYEPEHVVARQPRTVYHYYPTAYPTYYYPYHGYHHTYDHGHRFWGLSSIFALSWSEYHIGHYRHQHRKHRYYGRNYHRRHFQRTRDYHRPHAYKQRADYRSRLRHQRARLRHQRDLHDQRAWRRNHRYFSTRPYNRPYYRPNYRPFYQQSGKQQQRRNHDRRQRRYAERQQRRSYKEPGQTRLQGRSAIHRARPGEQNSVARGGAVTNRGNGQQSTRHRAADKQHRYQARHQPRVQQRGFRPQTQAPARTQARPPVRAQSRPPAQIRQRAATPKRQAVLKHSRQGQPSHPRNRLQPRHHLGTR